MNLEERKTRIREGREQRARQALHVRVRPARWSRALVIAIILWFFLAMLAVFALATGV